MTGYSGDSVPHYSGLVSIIKAHGYYKQYTYDKTLKKVHFPPDYTNVEIMATDGKAVLLLRNLYASIYGYRHLIQSGHASHTNATHLVGKGIKCLFS